MKLKGGEEKKKNHCQVSRNFAWPGGQQRSGQQGKSLNLGCSLAARVVWKADTCHTTASRGTPGAKVVNFCPDSLGPVQVMEDYLTNSSRTAAGMGSVISDWHQITVKSLGE